MMLQNHFVAPLLKSNGQKYKYQKGVAELFCSTLTQVILKSVAESFFSANLKSMLKCIAELFRNTAKIKSDGSTTGSFHGNW